MTENYIVFVEQPFKLDVVKLATAYFRGVTWGSCLKFDQDDIVSPSPPTLAADRTQGDKMTRLTPFSVPDLVSRHQQNDGKGGVHSFLRGRHGGFPPHQRIRGRRPRRARLDQLQGQRPVRHVLHPEREAGPQQLHQVQPELLSSGLPEVRPARQRQPGTVSVTDPAVSVRVCRSA